MKRPICTQPRCLLRDPACDAEVVAELAVAALTGRHLGDMDLEPYEPVERRDVCGACVRLVMEGRAALSTSEELERDDAEGRRSHRRERRKHKRMVSA